MVSPNLISKSLKLIFRVMSLIQTFLHCNKGIPIAAGNVIECRENVARFTCLSVGRAGACESCNVLTAGCNALEVEKRQFCRKPEDFLRRTKLNVL